MKVLLDANVVISGVVWKGNERALLGLARQGIHELWLSPEILAEVQRGLLKVGLTRERGESEILALSAIARVSANSLPISVPKALADDAHGLSVSRMIDADLLVTGDRRLLHEKQFGKTAIARAADALRILGIPLPR